MELELGSNVDITNPLAKLPVTCNHTYGAYKIYENKLEISRV